MIIEPKSKDGLAAAIHDYFARPWQRKSPRCAYCGAKAAHFINAPGNVVAPACDEPGCASRHVVGAIVLGGEPVLGGEEEVAS